MTCPSAEPLLHLFLIAPASYGKRSFVHPSRAVGVPRHIADWCRNSSWVILLQKNVRCLIAGAIRSRYIVTVLASSLLLTLAPLHATYHVSGSSWTAATMQGGQELDEPTLLHRRAISSLSLARFKLSTFEVLYCRWSFGHLVAVNS